MDVCIVVRCFCQSRYFVVKIIAQYQFCVEILTKWGMTEVRVDTREGSSVQSNYSTGTAVSK